MNITNIRSITVRVPVERPTAISTRQLAAREYILVWLDTDRLFARLEGMALDILRARSWLERFRFPRIEVAYEDLAARPEETLEEILRFLGIGPPVDGLHSQLVPSTDQPSLRRVENPDEVRAALAGSRFEWMLGEARR